MDGEAIWGGMTTANPTPKVKKGSCGNKVHPHCWETRTNEDQRRKGSHLAWDQCPL